MLRVHGKVFDIFHTVNCQSSSVIYIIECQICRLQYVRKSETAFNLRLNNHRNHIKTGVNSCKLLEHFLHNSRSHDFSKDITITIKQKLYLDAQVINNNGIIETDLYTKPTDKHNKYK